MNADTFANLPRWVIALLMALLFVVAPCISVHLGPDEITAARDTAAAARDVERTGLLASKE